MTALDSILKMRKPGNNSKGCGGVMRVAPIPLYAVVEGRMGIEDADGHHHPQPSGGLAPSLFAWKSL